MVLRFVQRNYAEAPATHFRPLVAESRRVEMELIEAFKQLYKII